MLATIDVGYRPRAQFVPFHLRSQRWACLVCHRRAGKTVASIADLQDAALRCKGERPRFAYIAPFLKQAKTVAWDYLKAGMAPLRSIGTQVNESELRIDYHNEGQVRLYGADNPDALRGIYLDGVVLDEFADMDPRIWPEIIRPALSDRKGWAAFIGTPKGRNEFWQLWRRAQAEDDWFALEIKASRSGLVDADELESARRDMTAEQYAQEYECSFDAAVIGAYYSKLITEAENATPSRVTGVPYDPAARVWTAWDLGYRDATAVWFAQMVGREIHLIDYYEAIGADSALDVKTVLSKRYNYAGHILPHDAFAKEKQTGKTTAEFMEGLGLRDIQRCPDHRVEDGITNAQMVLPRCWFDKGNTVRGVECLRLYHAEYDEKLKIVKSSPRHDWTSHAADAFRYLAVGVDNLVTAKSFNRKIEMPRMGIA